MKKSTLFFVCSTMLLLGTVIGFFLSPAQKGLYIGSNNGNTYGGGSGTQGGTDFDEDDDIPF